MIAQDEKRLIRMIASKAAAFVDLVEDVEATVDMVFRASEAFHRTFYHDEPDEHRCRLCGMHREHADGCLVRQAEKNGGEVLRLYGRGARQGG